MKRLSWKPLLPILQYPYVHWRVYMCITRQTLGKHTRVQLTNLLESRDVRTLLKSLSHLVFSFSLLSSIFSLLLRSVTLPLSFFLLSKYWLTLHLQRARELVTLSCLRFAFHSLKNKKTNIVSITGKKYLRQFFFFFFLFKTGIHTPNPSL